MNFVVWATVVWGVTMIVTTSKLFAPLRDRLPRTCGMKNHVTPRTFLGSLLACPMCFGWWVGAGFAALGYTPVVIVTPWLPGWAQLGLTIVSAGAAASAVCWTWHVVNVRLGSLDL
jgi:hypothetical protein